MAQDTEEHNPGRIYARREDRELRVVVKNMLIKNQYGKQLTKEEKSVIRLVLPHRAGQIVEYVDRDNPGLSTSYLTTALKKAAIEQYGSRNQAQEIGERMQYKFSLRNGQPYMCGIDSEGKSTDTVSTFESLCQALSGIGGIYHNLEVTLIPEGKEPSKRPIGIGQLVSDLIKELEGEVKGALHDMQRSLSDMESFLDLIDTVINHSTNKVLTSAMLGVFPTLDPAVDGLKEKLINLRGSISRLHLLRKAAGG